MVNWEEIALGFQHQLNEVVTELKGSNHRLEKIGQGQTTANIGLVKLDQQLSKMNVKLDEGLNNIDVRLDGLDAGFNSINAKLDEGFNSINVKLDGVGSYLRSINGHIQSHDDRIFKLEQRINKIEKKLDP